MTGLSRIAFVVSLSLSSFVFAEVNKEELATPVLTPENQHSTSSRRISAHYTRSHFKKVIIDDALSSEIFEHYLKQLDYNRSIFVVNDIESFEQYRNEFDAVVAKGNLDIAYDLFNLNIKRRIERYKYALTLLEKPFDFEVDEEYLFDREEQPWPKNTKELNELWRLKVKYDALSLILADKEWPQVQEKLTKRYTYAIKRIKQSKSEDVFQMLMNSFSRVVEPHTSYLSPDNVERFQQEMNLSLEGIGAVLGVEEDYTVIQRVLTGGPAGKSKQLKAKDKIIGVAQGDDELVDVVGWRLDDVVKLIKGPKGSEVRLQILTGDSGSDANLKIVSIIRDKIKLEDKAAKSEVYTEKTDGKSAKKLGVITIPSFYNNLTRDVKKELTKLQEENVEAIIVDLRSNGGGSLTEATLLTGLFIDRGPVVQVLDHRKRVNVNSDRDGITYYQGPLMVMVDRYSASASEIFSAAIQDYGRGIIIGEHTFGKGTVQQHRPLGKIIDLFTNPFGSIQYTIAKFYRINGGSTQHRGVIPDIIFPSAIDPADWGESKEENALPWDQIPKAIYEPLDQLIEEITYLETLHQDRIKFNPEFSYLQQDIIKYREDKDKKTVSLNINKRKAKREERKVLRLVRANERLVRLGQEEIKSIDDLPEELEELDPFLDETANITFDFLKLAKLAKQKK